MDAAPERGACILRCLEGPKFCRQEIASSLLDGRPMSRLAVVLFLLWGYVSIFPLALLGQDEPSLAERAEALRKKAQSEATPTASPTPAAAATGTPAKTVPALVATPKPTVYLRPPASGTPTPQSVAPSTASIGNGLSCKDYKNDELGLEINCLDNWTVVDPDKLTANKAIPVGKFRVQNGAEIGRREKNVYAMRDASGSAVVLTLVQFQPDDPLPINLRSDIQHAIAAEDP